MKTVLRWRAVAVWWRVGIRRGCFCGGGGELGDVVGVAVDGGEAWFMSWRREVRKVLRSWQIMSVEGRV